MGLSCYEQNAEVIQDSLMDTEEDDDFKAGLIALSSIVAGLQNPPKSEELEWSTDEQQTKVKISKLIRELEVSHTIGMSIDDMIEKLQKLSAIDKKVCILKSDGERKDSASYAGICPVCQSHIQLSMYSGEGKVSGASPDTANSKTQTVKIDFKYLKKAILKFDAKSVYQQAAIIMLRQVFKDYKEK